MQKTIDYFIKILIGFTFLVPIIVEKDAFIFPFIVPKILLFRTLVLLMLGCYLILLASDWNRYKIRFNLLNILVGLFFLSLAISTFVGVDWYRSFWDNHERMLGLFTIFHYVVFYYITTAVVKTWNEWKWLLRTFLGFGAVIMFIGFLQRYVNPELFLNRGSERVSATLGNSIYFSGYGLFLMFIGYLLAAKEKVKKTNPWFWYAVVGALLGFWGIFGGGTRGALLGMVVGLGVLAVSYIFSLKEQKRIKQGFGILIILGVIVASLLFNFRQTDFVKDIPAVGRLVNTKISSTNTRVMAWGIAVDAWKEKPVFGWGPNNYYYAFNKYYKAEFLNYGWGETWFDNAHSVIMNTLAVQGGLGIVVYLGIYIAAIIILWKKFRQKKIDTHVVSIGSAFLIANLVSLATVFENPTSYLYFFFFLAFVSGYKNNSDTQTEKKENENISVGLIIVTSLAILLLIYSTNINPARANMAALDTIKGFGKGEDVIKLYNTAKDIPTPHIDDIRNDFSRTSEQAIFNLSQNNHISNATSLFQLAHEEAKKNLSLHPLDIRVHIQLSKLCMLGAEITQNSALLFEAEKYLEEALIYSPKRQQIQYTLSLLKVQLLKGGEAIEIIEQSVLDNPEIQEGWWRLALIHSQLGDIQKAQEVVQKALDSGVVFDGQGQNVVNSILESN